MKRTDLLLIFCKAEVLEFRSRWSTIGKTNFWRNAQSTSSHYKIISLRIRLIKWHNVILENLFEDRLAFCFDDPDLKSIKIDGWVWLIWRRIRSKSYWYSYVDLFENGYERTYYWWFYSRFLSFIISGTLIIFMLFDVIWYVNSSLDIPQPLYFLMNKISKREYFYFILLNSFRSLVFYFLLG